ncbi:GNAT family N-acetyltransferase [Embleya sp. NPDC020886]|uniref:GNAT family N-acetyltransferase n=1 Tax=Embleya sp. NPDC020886 TaxID=3363980 RepID=UPI0037BB1F44
MSPASFVAEGTRIGVRRVRRQDREELAVLARESVDLHHPWVPAGESTPEAFESFVARCEAPTHEGLVLCLRSSGSIVGGVNINNIVRGSLQSGTLGYVAFASTTGRGYVTEGLRLVVRFAFGELGLHRLEANIQPGNVASSNVVRRVGFRLEGLSPNFQFMNGAWKDHERWAITTEMLDGSNG